MAFIHKRRLIMFWKQRFLPDWKLRMAGGLDEVQLLGYWASPFALRVEWALKLKEIHYEYVEEHLPEKSPMLLQYNPVHKKIPVLVHNGKPLAESLVILEYIDEVWKHNSLLPLDPLSKAKARFWAKFADEKCVPAMFTAFSRTGEEQERATKELLENLKTLESALERKQFFGGETIGFLDIAVGWIGYWAKLNGEVAGVNMLDEGMIPLLSAWFQKFLELPIIKECLPPEDKLLAHLREFHKMLIAAST